LRDWRAVAALFSATTTLEAIAFGQIQAFTPLYLATFGLSPEEVARTTGLLTALSMAVAFPLAPFWGVLAERFSRKPIIVRSQILETTAFAILAFAPDLTWVVFARILIGLTFGNIALLIASQSLLTPTRHLGVAISLVQGAIPVASSIGPPLGAFLIPGIGIRGLFLLDAIGCLIAGLLLTLFMPEPDTPRSRTPVVTAAGRNMLNVWRKPALRWNFAIWFASRGAMAVLSAYIPVQILRLVPDDPAPAIGFVLGGHGAVMALATWASGPLADRLPPARLLWTTMVMATVFAVGVAVAPNLVVLAVCAWLVAIPSAISGIVLYTHLAQVLQPTERAPVLSLTPFPRNMGMFALPGLAAAVAVFGTGASLGVAAAAYAGGTVAAWLIARLPRRPASASTTDEADGSGKRV
jgi:DHA1 family multidrug resistance protein-like MFS transporter